MNGSVPLVLVAGSLWLGGCVLHSSPATRSGEVVGVVIDARTSNPVAGARVIVVERGLRTWSSTDGWYGFVELRAGTLTLAAFASDCRVASGVIQLSPGERRRITLALEHHERDAFREQFVRATDRRSDGASTREIRASELERSPVRTLGEYLPMRYPELFEAGSGQPGAAPRFRARTRGLSGPRLEPMVLVDGVLVGGGGRGAESGMQALSRLAVSEIHRVRIQRGPAASAMYGTGAAAGVIHVETLAGHMEHPTEIEALRC